MSLAILSRCTQTAGEGSGCVLRQPVKRRLLQNFSSFFEENEIWRSWTTQGTLRQMMLAVDPVKATLFEQLGASKEFLWHAFLAKSGLGCFAPSNPGKGQWPIDLSHSAWCFEVRDRENGVLGGQAERLMPGASESDNERVLWMQTKSLSGPINKQTSLRIRRPQLDVGDLQRFVTTFISREDSIRISAKLQKVRCEWRDANRKCRTVKAPSL